MSEELKQRLVGRLKQVGAFDVRVADPAVGYEHALPGKHPLEVWQRANSVVVFAIACSGRMNNLYLGPYAPWEGERQVGPVPDHIRSDQYGMDRLVRIFIHAATLRGIEVLQTAGHEVAFWPQANIQLKLSGYEAGLGVYGRSGVLLHPVLGNRMRLGALLTDAVLEPDGRLEGYEPCRDCDLCIKACPAGAYDATKPYPESWSREKCMPKRAEIAEGGHYCHNCFAVCPAGQVADEDLLCVREAVSFYGPHRSEAGTLKTI
jgi:ferredoxin